MSQPLPQHLRLGPRPIVSDGFVSELIEQAANWDTGRPLADWGAMQAHSLLGALVDLREARQEARRFYLADGTFEEMEPEQVIERRKRAARAIVDAASQQGYLIIALMRAVKLIEQWHNMNMGELGERGWKIYYLNAPEMQPIRDAWKFVEGGGDEAASGNPKSDGPSANLRGGPDRDSSVQVNSERRAEGARPSPAKPQLPSSMTDEDLDQAIRDGEWALEREDYSWAFSLKLSVASLKELQALRTREAQRLEPDHQCEPVGVVNHSGPGRDWWIGRITRHVEGYEHETHCLHITTPRKAFVLMVNAADVAALYCLLGCAEPQPDPAWRQGQIDAYRREAATRAGEARA